jgi:adenine/guanine phosphoribosyltransferase-like PRPP-binding protein
MASNLTIFKESIVSYPDFPKPGVNFKDVFSVLKNPDGYEALLELVKEKAR